MDTSDEKMKEILLFCYQNKIIFEFNKEGTKNKFIIDKVDEKNRFVLSIPNPKDKKLEKLIVGGFKELKNLINQISTK